MPREIKADPRALEQWSGKPFRKPDDVVGTSYAVWYGPGKREEAEAATEVDVESGGYSVAEYTYVGDLIEEPDPEEFAGRDFTKQTIHVEVEELLDALKSIDVVVTERQIEEPTPDEELMLVRWAASYGVAKIAYWGGEEEFVDALP